MSDNENSLGDQNTFDGGDGQFDPQSLGDEMTFGGRANDADDSFDDGMEVVDLEARYKIEGTLGKGGMGEVLLATDTRLERKVAIKRILGTAARSKTAVSRFLTEAKSVAALNHPNIVQIYDYGRAKDGPFLIMEYVEGESLLDKCRQGPIELEEAVNLTCQLCEGLAKAHAANIIHRDIKPANVLMTPDGVPKLTDFGLAKDDTADTGMTMAGAVLGTLDFMPPEQRKDAALTDNRSDLWSLAASLYQMVTGEPPRVLDLDLVPQQLRTALSRALKSNKEDRFQDAFDFRDALQLSSQEPISRNVGNAELGAGECPKCHTVNTHERKFCSNGKCAAALRVPCLGCNQEIPVWDSVCGECGGKQVELLLALHEDYQYQLSIAKEKKNLYQYRQAKEHLFPLTNLSDSRHDVFIKRASDLLSEVDKEEKRQISIADDRFQQAMKHRQAYDYGSAIRTLELIPEPVRSELVIEQVKELVRDRDNAKQLLGDIKSCLKKRELDGLLVKVNKLIKLVGERSDLVHIKQQLERRDARIQQALWEKQAHEDEIVALRQQAWNLYKSKDYSGAKSVLGSLDQNDFGPQEQEIDLHLRLIETAEHTLESMMRRAKVDATVSDLDLIDIAKQTLRCLELDSSSTIGNASLKIVHKSMNKRGVKFALQLSRDTLGKLLSEFRGQMLPDLPEEIRRIPNEDQAVSQLLSYWNSLSRFSDRESLEGYRSKLQGLPTITYFEETLEELIFKESSSSDSKEELIGFCHLGFVILERSPRIKVSLARLRDVSALEVRKSIDGCGLGCVTPFVVMLCGIPHAIIHLALFGHPLWNAGSVEILWFLKFLQYGVYLVDLFMVLMCYFVVSSNFKSTVIINLNKKTLTAEFDRDAWKNRVRKSLIDVLTNSGCKHLKSFD